MLVLVIILSSAPHQQGCSIFMTTSPSFNEHPSYFLVQNAVGTFGHIVSQPWLSSAKYSVGVHPVPAPIAAASHGAWLPLEKTDTDPAKLYPTFMVIFCV